MGLDPAQVWRGTAPGDPPQEDPWPSRTEAFVAACAIHAGRAEENISFLADVAEGWAKANSKR